MSKLTVKCKLAPTPVMTDALLETCEAFAAACNTVLQVALKNHISNQVRLQNLAYRTIREQFGLSANLAVRAVARVAAAMTAAKRRGKPPQEFRPTSIGYDARIFDFREKDETVSLTTVKGRIHVPLVLGTYQRERLTGRRPTAATVVRDGKKWSIHITVEFLDDPPRKGPPLGVDLGIRNTATLSTGRRFPGTKRTEVKDRYARVRASLQSKGTEGCRKTLRRLSGRERRWIRWENHNLSRQIVREAADGGFGMIRMEDLKDIRKRTKRRSRHLNRMISGWSFGELQDFTAYKAKRVGLAVERVNPAWSSQTCSVCGARGVRRGDTFSCTACGTVKDADDNAAEVIAAGGAACKPAWIGERRVA